MKSVQDNKQERVKKVIRNYGHQHKSNLELKSQQVLLKNKDERSQ